MRNGDFVDNLVKAIKSCECFIPILTPAYSDFRDNDKADDFCKLELITAIKNKKIIIPVLPFGDKVLKNLPKNIIVARTDIENVDEWSFEDLMKFVVETLICLFELNAEGEESKELLFVMLKSMQTTVQTPNYDILCNAVSQFIDQKINKPTSESILIKGMLERGETGIKTFNCYNYKCSKGANPYDELFYYVVVHNFTSGLIKLYKENHSNTLSPIQTYLYNELCKVMHLENTQLSENDCAEFKTNFISASSKKRANENKLKGHVNILNSVQSIGYWAFYGCFSLTDINFKGTKEQWKKIQGFNDCCIDYTNCTVHCLDGDIDGAGE